ncbi:ectoine hydroxylase [Hydrogenibacillus schlegelii]|nr:ectoine hydroxylase [Hydrogenibacillus schlegelii]
MGAPSLMEDRYPSRTGEGTRWIERKDPVVYGRPEDGPLSAEELREYEAKGFLLLRDVFSPEEVRAFREELRRLFEERAHDPSPEVVREPESDVVRSIFRVHRTSEVFRRLADDPRLRDVARQILGSDVYIHQSRINYKKGFHGQEFFWHSDFETWHVEDGMPRMRALSVSVALEDNFPFNGPLLLMPGSHRVFVACPGRTPERHYERSLRRQEYGVPDEESLARLAERYGIEAAVGPAGSVLFFDSNVMHGSNGNITPYPRSNVFFVYNSVENRLVAPFSGQEPRPAYLAER